jgi:hypothetical protein
VDDPFARQISRAGNAGFPGGAASVWAIRHSTAFFQERGAGCPVDRAVNTAAAQQSGVGRIDNRVNSQGGYISGYHFECYHKFHK